MSETRELRDGEIFFDDDLLRCPRCGHHTTGLQMNLLRGQIADICPMKCGSRLVLREKGSTTLIHRREDSQ